MQQLVGKTKYITHYLPKGFKLQNSIYANVVRRILTYKIPGKLSPGILTAYLDADRKRRFPNGGWRKLFQFGRDFFKLHRVLVLINNNFNLL